MCEYGDGPCRGESSQGGGPGRSHVLKLRGAVSFAESVHLCVAHSGHTCKR